MERAKAKYKTRLGLCGRIGSFRRDTRGATASEYAAILALLILTVLVSINVLGMSVTGSFTNVGGNLSAVAGGSGGGGSGGGGSSGGKGGSDGGGKGDRGGGRGSGSGGGHRTGDGGGTAGGLRRGA